MLTIPAPSSSKRSRLLTINRRLRRERAFLRKLVLVLERFEHLLHSRSV